MLFWDCDADLRAILAGRRYGKSHVLIPWLVSGTIDSPGAVNPFLSITRKHAKINFWRHLKEEALATGREPKINEADLTIDFNDTGGGLIWLGGYDNVNELEKARGSGTSRAVVDECGTMPPEVLQYLVLEVLRPATADFRGQIALAGTCGKILDGYWYELTREDSDIGIPVFRGTMLDNPYMPDPEGFLRQVLDENGWTWETPVFCREYLAKWTADPGALVFPIGDQNRVDELPRFQANGQTPLDVSKWRYVIGVDVGYVAASAIVVVAGHLNYPREFVISSEKHTEMLPRNLAERLRDLLEVYPKAPIVVDTGGMGKVHAEEMRRLYALPVLDAEKRDKESQIELVRDRIQSGKIKIMSGPCNDCIREECAVLGWDEDALEKGKRLPSKNTPDHAVDAMLYALRKLRAYHAETKKIPPTYQSERWAKEEVQRMLDARTQARKRAMAKSRSASGWRRR